MKSAPKEMIRIENFHKSFGKKSVHRGVTFSVLEKECIGLLGGSGQGKSVILRSMIGLQKPDKGAVYIGDDNISDWNEEQLVEVRKKVAYAFQNGALFDSMTVFENLAYPLREHTKLSEKEIEKKVHELLEDFDLKGNDKVFPNDLSGGMQKRVGLARAIIMGPSVILYDEPTAGLDPKNTVMIQQLILKLKKRGVTSVLVTHDMPSALATCDRIALLGDGVIKDIGTVEELKKQSHGPLQKFIEGAG